MTIVKHNFPQVLNDNEATYFSYLEGLINSRDEYSSMEVTKTPTSYLFRLAPSVPRYTEMLLQELLILHNQFNIHLDLSKSIKTSSSIVFQINLNN